jgi:hypothetical protein
METGIWVRAKTDPAYYSATPAGEIITLYGHGFIVQYDRTLGMFMHRDYVRDEVASGRVEIVNPPKRALVKSVEEALTLEDFIAKHKIKSLDEIEETVSSDPDEPITAETIVASLDTLAGFTMDIGTFYGCNDVNALFEKISVLKNKQLIIQFVADRFKVKVAPNAGRDDIIEQVRDLVDKSRVEWQQKDDSKKE